MFGIAHAQAELDEGVLVLTDANFDEEIAKYDYLLVEFYAPWCGHCKKLAPEYAAAAQVLATQDPPMFVAKVDSTENSAISERFGVKGFPTLHWFVNGERQDYTGGREKDTIISWINKKTGPASNELNCADLKSKTADGRNFVYFGTSFDGEDFNAFLKVAQQTENYSFYHNAEESCATEHGVAFPGAAVFRNFDEHVVPFTGAFTAEDITNFITVKSQARFITFTEDTIEPIFGNKRSALILFTEETDSDAQKTFFEAANELEGEILFVQSGVTDGIQSRLAEFVGVEKADLPTVRLIDPAENLRKFVYSGDAATINVEQIKTFVNDFKTDKLEVHLKSEEIPETQGAVTKLVGKQWAQIVTDTSKDVLVEYYAPWCGHCKKLAPIWEELGEYVKDVEDLVIAQFDATANEVDGLEVRGYPTLIWYPKDNKTGVTYEGARELPDFKEWLNENSAAYKAAGIHQVAAAEETHTDEL